MQGKVIGNSVVVMDSFALPVQGTETRVNAANEANEYMVEYVNKSEKVHIMLCRTMTLVSSHFSSLGRAFGECHWLVPLPSWLRMLALRY